MPCHVDTHFFKVFSSVSLFKLFTFRARGREGEREGKKHPCERETPIGLSQVPGPGTKRETQACVLTFCVAG